MFDSLDIPPIPEEAKKDHCFVYLEGQYADVLGGKAHCYQCSNCGLFCAVDKILCGGWSYFIVDSSINEITLETYTCNELIIKDILT